MELCIQTPTNYTIREYLGQCFVNLVFPQKATNLKSTFTKILECQMLEHGLVRPLTGTVSGPQNDNLTNGTCYHSGHVRPRQSGRFRNLQFRGAVSSFFLNFLQWIFFPFLQVHCENLVSKWPQNVEKSPISGRKKKVRSEKTA